RRGAHHGRAIAVDVPAGGGAVAEAFDFLEIVAGGRIAVGRLAAQIFFRGRQIDLRAGLGHEVFDGARFVGRAAAAATDKDERNQDKAADGERAQLHGALPSTPQTNVMSSTHTSYSRPNEPNCHSSAISSLVVRPGRGSPQPARCASHANGI